MIKLSHLYFRILSKISPLWAVQSAHKFFHTPINSRRKNRNEKAVENAEKFLVPFDKNTSLQAYRWGKYGNPIVLLVHGWSTTSKSMTHFIDALLQENYQVISYDALRHGETKGQLSDLGNWAMSVRAMMLAIGEVECIVAHSFGGAAVTVASKLGLKTKKLLFLAPINNAKEIAERFGVTLGVPDFIVERMLSYTWENNKETLAQFGKDWEEIFLSNFKVPTLIFHDKNDKEIGIEHSKKLCKHWIWAELRETENLGHRRILDSEEVVKESIKFIKEENEETGYKNNRQNHKL